MSGGIYIHKPKFFVWRTTHPLYSQWVTYMDKWRIIIDTKSRYYWIYYIIEERARGNCGRHLFENAENHLIHIIYDT